MTVLLAALLAAEPAAFTFTQARTLVRTYCVTCHQGPKAPSGLNLARFSTMPSMLQEPRIWSKVLARVRDGEMPPKGKPAPGVEQREKFSSWIENTLARAACADGITPGPSPIRRLNRNEYGATLRDLLNIHFNAGHALPADGAGGEGFDNAAETLFLSPLHAEKYLEAARAALEYGARDPRSRSRFIPAEPNATTTPEQAARKTMESFLPRAFRRPAAPGELERHLKLFRTAQAQNRTFEDAILYALQGVLLSPDFLFRIEERNPNPGPRLVGDYEIASRLSYFLWGTMPDQTLFDLAAKGELNTPEALSEQVVRLLRDPKARDFAESFVEQWLNTRELGRDIKPDQKLFPAYYDAELKAAIRYEPILFFQEILAENLSLLNLLDSRHTFLNNRLQRHYGYSLPGQTQFMKHAVLPEGHRRGGLVGMAAVLAVSSLPHRTSPVLRGKWVLDSVLGTPPPPPPSDVPEIEETNGAANPKTVRERLEQHRRVPVCAACHSRIDPLGFGLENYDVLGRWRSEEAGQPIDSRGELPDGTTFDGPDQLRHVLTAKRDLFVRNLAVKMLGYALGRGLTFEDYCTVDRMVENVKRDAYGAHSLVQGIVLSVPFRMQDGAPKAAVRTVTRNVAPKTPVRKKR